MSYALKLWYYIIQSLLWPVAGGFFRIFYRIKIDGQENLRLVQKPVIITSNHKTLFDGFFVGLALPWLSRLFPLRIMAANTGLRGKVMQVLTRIKILQLFYLFLGGFFSGRGQGVDSAIQTPLKLLAQKNTILMFPEGRLIEGEKLGNFFHGTSALALKSGARILPFFIKIVGREVSLRIGKPFFLEAHKVEYGTIVLKEKLDKLA